MMEQQKKIGFAHLVIGGTGTGKTTYIKHLISGKENLIVYDVNAEYLNEYPYPFIRPNEFMTKIVNSENKLIVFEEATIFFNNRSHNEELETMLVRKRHQSNYIILVFHSLRAVPRYVWDLCNFMTLFKTNDNESFVKNKIPNDLVYDAFMKVRENEQLTELKIPGTDKSVYYTTITLY